MTFGIDCGNKKNATNSARDVRIVAYLNPAVLDMSTLNLGNMLVVTDTVSPTPGIVPIQGQQEFNATFSDIEAAVNANLDMNPDPATGMNILTWDFQSTNSDNNVGFLQPGQNIQVFFTVMPKADLPTGTLTSGMWAVIYFEGHPYINKITGTDQNPWTAYPIDYDPPTSGVWIVGKATRTDPNLSLHCLWSKPSGSSSMQDVTLFVSVDNGGFVPLQVLSNPALSGSAYVSYTGTGGHTYSFYSIARDYAGNVQPIPSKPHSVTVVTGPYLLTFNANPVLGGQSVTGQVTINIPAPAEGAVVTLTSSNAAVASVLGSVTIPAGATSATFPITTQPVSARNTVSITATYSGQSVTNKLVVSPAVPQTLTFNPNPVRGGTSSQGTVTLNGIVPVNTTVSLKSSIPTVAAVPASVVVPAGSASANFMVTTFKVTASKAVTITATANAHTVKAVLTVQP